MKLRPEQLSGQLQRELAPIYLLSGDEPLLLQEAAEQVIVAATRAGFSERTIWSVDSGFDWEELTAAGNALSLFAEQKIIDLRIPNGRPGKGGEGALLAWSRQPPPDQILLIRTPKLESRISRTQWYRAIEQSGVAVAIWPLDRSRIPAWVEQRMRQQQLRPTAEAVAMVADRIEGNLLAAVQEIEKIALLVSPGTTVDGEMVARLVADSARFDPFQLADTILAGEQERSLRILQELRQEGSAIQLVLWPLVRDLRELVAVALPQRLAAHKPVDRSISPMIWKRRLPLFRAALGRLRPNRLPDLLQQAGEIDRIGKGMAVGDPWLALELLVLAVAGEGRMDIISR